MPELSQTLLKEATRHYNLKPDSFRLLEDAGNPSYEANFQGQEAVLRFSSRSENMIRGEIDFMTYLASNGMRVPETYPSRDNEPLAIVADDEHQYILTLFEKLPGEHPEGGLLTEDVIRLYGRDIGKMHRLSTTYTPATPEIRRPNWYDYDVFDRVNIIPEHESAIRDHYQDMLNKLKSLPVDKAFYGMIHADTEPWNCLLHDNQLSWIDFDDSSYCHFVFDIAVSITYILIASVPDVLNPDNDEKNKTAQRIWKQFYEGYKEEYSLSDAQRALIPDFLRFRVMQDFVHHLTVFDFNNLLDWQKYVYNSQRRIILNNEDFLKVDWV